MPGPRIVSLIASATETVAALGLLPNLVGRSHECDFPSEVARLPICSQPKLDYHASSYRIDQQVKALLRDGLSIYTVDVDRLRDLRPDLVLTQTHCEVCAVSEKDVEAALGAWLGTRPRLVALHPDRLQDVWRGMEQIAAACGVPERGAALVETLRQRLRAIAESCARAERRPSVGCIEWADPLMVAGNWMPELVELAGAVDPLGQPGRHSPLCSWDRLAAADPDVVVLLPCGYDLPRARKELPLLAARPEWSALTAVRAGRAYVVDGSAYMNRPGPRLVESLEILAEILHPRLVHFGHEGQAWERLAP